MRINIVRHRDSRIEETVCADYNQLVKVGGYPYTLHPFQAVIPQYPDFMEHAADIVTKHNHFNRGFNYVFALAQKSIPFATYISQKTRKPLLVAYSRKYTSMPSRMAKSEIKIVEPKKYANPHVLYSYFLKLGDKVTYVADDINWGDASTITLTSLVEKGITIPNFVFGVEKFDRKGIDNLTDELNRLADKNPTTNIHICASVVIDRNMMKPLAESPSANAYSKKKK